MGEFLSIPATESFADTLVTYCEHWAVADSIPLSEFKIYVPTRRAIRTMKEAFLRGSKGQARLLPLIQAIGDSDDTELSFITPHAPDLIPAISAMERQIILARLLEKAWAGTYDFNNALKIAADLGHLIDQIHTENIALSRLDTVVEFREFSEHWNITLSFLKLLLDDLWPNYLQTHGLCDPGLYRRLRIESLNDFYQKNAPKRPVIIAGSTGSHPATRALIKTIHSCDFGRIILPALDQVMDEAQWIEVKEGHPQYLIKRLLDYCKIPRKVVRGYGAGIPDHPRLFAVSQMMCPAEKTDQWQSLSDPITQKIIESGMGGITLCAADNEEREARIIAFSMAEIAADKTQEKTCTLITPDRNLAARVQSNLKQWGIVCDDSAGTPLPQTSLGRFVLSSIKAQQIGQIYPLPFLSTLKSIHAGGGIMDNFRTHLRRLEKDVLRGVRPYGSIADLKNHTDRHNDFITHLAQIFEPLSMLGNDRHPLKDWVDAHIAVIESIAATPDQSGTSRLWIGHIGEAMANFFEQIQNYDHALAPMTQTDYAAFIDVMMGTISVRPPYGTHPRLSILGQIEARMVSADRVILAGLNEGTWPPDSGFDAWMSRPMRADFGLPSLEQKTTLAAHDFATALGGRDVFITYSRRKGGQPAMPSRWIQRMETMMTAAKIDPAHWPHHRGETYCHWERILHHPDTVQPCTRPMPTPTAIRRPTKFSVTDFGRWMRNPYALYAKKVLRLRKLDDVDMEASVADKGTLIHAAMESFTKAYPVALPNQPLSHLLTIGRDHFDAAAPSPEIQGLWWPRFEMAAQWVIDHEQTWRNDTMRIHSEQECAMTITIDGKDYDIIGKADRIEQRTGGEWAIIDYKTGSMPATKDVNAGIDNQLPIEAFILKSGGFGGLSLNADTTIDSFYWTLSGGKQGGEARIAQGPKGNDSQSLTDQAGEGIHNLITAFADGSVPYIATPDASISLKYNDYEHLERMAEWSVIDGGEDAA